MKSTVQKTEKTTMWIKNRENAKIEKQQWKSRHYFEEVVNEKSAQLLF